MQEHTYPPRRPNMEHFGSAREPHADAEGKSPARPPDGRGRKDETRELPDRSLRDPPER